MPYDEMGRKIKNPTARQWAKYRSGRGARLSDRDREMAERPPRRRRREARYSDMDRAIMGRARRYRSQSR